MNKNRYKDLIATGIVLGIFGVFVFVYWLAKYTSQETKEMVGEIVISILMLIVVGLVWKAIRLLID